MKPLSLMYSVSSSHILSLQLSASTYETVKFDVFCVVVSYIIIAVKCVHV